MSSHINFVVSEVESIGFRARVGVASTVDVFIKCVYNDLAFKRLIVAIRKEVFPRTEVLNRIATLVGAEFDRKYRNPFDVAIAAYLLSLNFVGSETVAFAATQAMRLSDGWWTKAIVAQLSYEQVRSDSSDLVDWYDMFTSSLGKVRSNSSFSVAEATTPIWSAGGLRSVSASLLSLDVSHDKDALITHFRAADPLQLELSHPIAAMLAYEPTRVDMRSQSSAKLG